MRRPEPHDPLARWLQAEREADDAVAEAALLEMFESLPQVAPSAGFADRVLLQIAEPAIEPVRQNWLVWLFRSPGFRLALTSGVLAACISLFWLPRLLMTLLGMATMNDLVQLGVTSLVDLSQWLGLASRVGEWFLTVLRALAISLTSPGALKVTAGCLAISGISFVFLRELMTRDRSLRYVDPIR
ncbi:MAG TPA: hypothetical protein VNM67_10790 [Thermoanaerobaculia bacterium]|jgi:hypothetical protein|nr:hypothetical protein [Thermoanaerobaculia bacterium]